MIIRRSNIDSKNWNEFHSNGETERERERVETNTLLLSTLFHFFFARSLTHISSQSHSQNREKNYEWNVEVISIYFSINIFVFAIYFDLLSHTTSFFSFTKNISQWISSDEKFAPFSINNARNQIVCL